MCTSVVFYMTHPINCWSLLDIRSTQYTENEMRKQRSYSCTRNIVDSCKVQLLQSFIIGCNSFSFCTANYNATIHKLIGPYSRCIPLLKIVVHLLAFWSRNLRYHMLKSQSEMLGKNMEMFYWA